MNIIIRPRRWTIIINLAVVLLFIGHIFIAINLIHEDTGVPLNNLDVWAFIFVGLVWSIIAKVIFSFKLTIREEGVIVKNFWPTNRIVYWSEINSIIFPENKRWPRILLAQDEYIPLMAIQRIDREFALKEYRKLLDIFANNSKLQSNIN